MEDGLLSFPGTERGRAALRLYYETFTDKIKRGELDYVIVNKRIGERIYWTSVNDRRKHLLKISGHCPAESPTILT